MARVLAEISSTAMLISSIPFDARCELLIGVLHHVRSHRFGSVACLERQHDMTRGVYSVQGPYSGYEAGVSLHAGHDHVFETDTLICFAGEVHLEDCESRVARLGQLFDQSQRSEASCERCPTRPGVGRTVDEHGPTSWVESGGSDLIGLARALRRTASLNNRTNKRSCDAMLFLWRVATGPCRHCRRPSREGLAASEAWIE